MTAAVPPSMLIAGFTKAGIAKASWHGALRTSPSAYPVWKCPHDHLATGPARKCAETELERRKAGAQAVFHLLNCEGCSRWWADTPGAVACPRCSVPLRRAKVHVLEWVPVSGQG